MPRSPLAQRLHDLVATVGADHDPAPRTGTGEPDPAAGISRRTALRLGGAAGRAAGAAALGPTAAAAPKPPPPSTGGTVAVVGAGLAGLTCAYELKQAGVQATVYELTNRVGGRSWTLRGAFADGQLVERGGQLIDQGHTHIRQLAGRLGLTLDNALRAEPSGSEPLYFFDGEPYTYDQAADDLNGIYQKLHRDVSEASYPTLYDQSTQRGRELDQLSVVDWINETVPGGAGTKLGQLLATAYTIEYGADAEQQKIGRAHV
jgi:monoamine oxidase